MYFDTHTDRLITKKLLAQKLEEKENHIPSGKLSASMLGWPLQWQILKVLGFEHRIRPGKNQSFLRLFH